VKKILTSILTLAFSTVAYSGEVQQVYINDTGSYYFAGKPKATDEKEIKLLENTGFVVGYLEGKKTPAWVCYQVAGSPVYQIKRPSGFNVDSLSEYNHHVRF